MRSGKKLYKSSKKREIVEPIITEEPVETPVPFSNSKIKFHVFNPDNHVIETHKDIIITPADDRKTSEKLTEYEYTEVVSHRAKQIENGGPIYVDIGDETDPIKMAELEINLKKCPLSIRRLHNNSIAEIWEVNEMTLPY